MTGKFRRQSSFGRLETQGLYGPREDEACTKNCLKIRDFHVGPLFFCYPHHWRHELSTLLSLL